MTDFFDRSANQRRSQKGPFVDQRTASRKRRRKQRRRSFVILVMAIAFLSSVSVIFIPEFFKESKVVEDYPGPGSGKVSIVIPESATGREIAAILKEKGVIANAQPFIDAYNNDKRAQSQIKPGVYELKKRMSSAGALASLLGRLLHVGDGHVEVVRQPLIDLLFRPAFRDGDP
ncbi:MAG: endolytic transglycosylase MltG, partial [Peptidiphaga gingivicola]